MSKSILIDATHFHSAQATGVEYYVSLLLPQLSQQLQEKSLKVSWIGHSLAKPQGAPEEVEWISSAHRPLWSQRTLLKVLNQLQPDLYFTPSGIPPLLYKGATALTVHDMGAYLLPQAYTLAQLLRLRTILKKATQKAKIVLTPSQFSKEQIHHHWNIPLGKIAVTPLALTDQESTVKAVEGVNIQRPFFLFMGRIEFKKNLLPLLQGFSTLAATSPEAQLVLAGKAGHGSEELQSAIQDLPEKIQKSIIQTGYISDEEKRWLYHHAQALLVPGLAEGFSLPMLEAFNAKVPVIASLAGPHPEIGQGAVCYVKGTDPSDWCGAMKRLLTDLEFSTQLCKAGTERLKDFNWEATARLTAVQFIHFMQTYE